MSREKDRKRLQGNIFVLLIIFLFILLIAYQRKNDIIESLKGVPSLKSKMPVALVKEFQNEPLKLAIGEESLAGARYAVGLQTMRELDFQSKAAILKMRKDAVLKHPRLIRPGYEPSEAVFGQIDGGRAWWGIEGLYYYGSGLNSIKGVSEESRFLLNPYLLVGLAEPNAFARQDKINLGLIRSPKPLWLIWYPESAKAHVRYDVGSYFRFFSQFNYPQADERKLSLVAYNARDFGLNFLYVDLEKSNNVTSSQSPGHATEIKQMLHLGNSCGHPDGCNNMSPNQTEFNLQVAKLPAKFVVKLWHAAPKSTVDQEDFEITFDLV